MTVNFSKIKIGDYDFDIRRCGEAGEAIILLHGFPETSHMWIPLMEQLGQLGYQTAAIDQRGYSSGARPSGAAHYSYEAMAADVTGLADALGFDRFHLIGHDHGAGLGWYVAGHHADRIITWTALSVPHIDAFADAISNNAEQSEKSQYILFFQQEGAAEAAMSENNFAMLKDVWSKSSPDQVEEYLRVLTQDGALTGALNWYRGVTIANEARKPVGKIGLPTLLIWGNQDQAIGRPGVDATPPLMTGYYKLEELDAGHWLIQEAQADVIAAITDHLKRFSE